MANLESNVALFIFRRPDATARVLERILAAGPQRLLVVADGPRVDIPGEQELCFQTRALIDQARTVCEVVTNYAQSNLGLRKRMSSGLDWIFEQSDRAIILEDDCLPEPSFFPFCDELLQRFADDPRIFMISGDNFLPRSRRFANSYHFSHFVHIWGWASWRRAWKRYDVDMTGWPARRNTKWLESKLGAEDEVRFWRDNFDGVYDGRVNTWDFQWQYACFANDGLSVVPARHLVTNIGLDTSATNTVNPQDPHFRARAEPLPLPLKHPKTVQRNVEADHKEFRALFGKPGQFAKLLRKAGKRFRRLAARLRSPKSN